jgi:hypothetical protein
MNCQRAERLLSYQQDNVLSARERRAVEAHLAACPACRHRQESFYAVGSALREWEEREPPTDLLGRALARWDSEQATPPAYARRRPFARPLFASLAAGALLAVLGWAFLHRHGQATPKIAGLEQTQTVAPFAPPKRDKSEDDSQGQKIAVAPPPRLHPNNGPSTQHAVRDAHYATHHTQPAIRITQHTMRSMEPDSRYLDGRDLKLAAYWAAGVNDASAPAIDLSLPPVRDDFVRIPLPPIAGMDSRAVEAARRVYAQEAQIVDPRLFRNVTLHEKGTSLASLCATLEKQTGVKLAASRGMTDEKATVLVNELPARDVMRAVARLFDCYWERSGEEGAYGYALKQDLKSQFEEEELRNKDINAALLALDRAMAASKSITPAVQAYQQLTPAERMDLRSGKEIRFSTDGEIPAGFPAGWAKHLLESFGTFFTPAGKFTPAETPGAVADVTFSLVYSELGQVSLECQSAVNPPGLAGMSTLATGRSPSSARPDNRTANKEPQSDPAFQQKIALAPKVCSKPDFKTKFGVDFSKIIYIEDDIQDSVSPPTPHVNSSDVWEAVHEKTGLPIVADYYTHLYPAQDFTIEKPSLYDVLCQVGDSLGVRWKRDGDFLLCRSISFFWDKRKEVPNRLLDRWQADRERNGGLPLDDLLEMATLTDQQLESTFVGQGVRHCRGIMEWNILSNPGYAGMRRKYDTIRPLARFLATLSQSLRARALSADGLTVNALPPVQQEMLHKLGGAAYPSPTGYDGMRFRIDYVPAGWYYWRIIVDNKEEADRFSTNPPLIFGKTSEETLAAARRIYAKASPDAIPRSYGQLVLTLISADGTVSAIGKHPLIIRIAL